MARNELSLAKILYFCNVKIQMRHEVAGNASVFRALTLVEKYNRIECSSSNAYKGFAFGTLTTRNAVFFIVKTK